MQHRFVAAAIAAGVAASVAHAQWLSPWGYDGKAVPGVAGGIQDSPVVDPLGDAVDTFGAGPPLLDIDTIDVTYDATDLSFSMTFHTPIAPASAGVPESLAGVFEFDIDKDPFTGNAPVQNIFSPPFAFLNLGIDYVLDFNSEAATPGQALLLPIGAGDATLIPLEFTEFSVSGVIPLDSLGFDDGDLHFSTIIGTGPQPTDATNVIGASVPAPGAAALLVIGGLGLTRRRR